MPLLDRELFALAVRVWLMEIVVAGFNFFVLMNLIVGTLWLRHHARMQA